MSFPIVLRRGIFFVTLQFLQYKIISFSSIFQMPPPFFFVDEFEKYHLEAVYINFKQLLIRRSRSGRGGATNDIPLESYL